MLLRYTYYIINTIIKMNHTIKTFAMMVLGAALLLVACDRDDNNGTPATEGNEKLTLTAAGVNFDVVRVAAGSFTMGANPGDPDATEGELPHEVTLTQDFYIGQTEVTQELYEAVTGSNPSFFDSDGSLPVERVSYAAALAFCEQLSALTGRTFTLPTEAQWEYAARGGHRAPATPTLYAGSDDIEAVAWYNGNSGGKSHPVATKTPNALGIHDMSGNVWEWCLDRKGDYAAGAQTDPQGPASGSNRIFRGGGWYDPANRCRLSQRDGFIPEFSNENLGFRVAMIP